MEEVGIFPVGEGLASEFAHKGSTLWIVIFAFMIGFGTTVAEPALLVIADKAAGISSGRIDAFTLRMVVAFSVGLAIVIGVWRIIKGHPIHYYIISGYILVVAATFFSPKEIVGLAFDLGGVTTSTVTVPLVAALGIGLASSIKGRNPVLDGFGLIAFASLTPMIFVQFYGIYVYEFIEASDIVMPISEHIAETAMAFDFIFINLVKGFFGVVTDVVPILAVILFFQYAILKKPIDNLKEVLIGFGLVIIGLDAFIIGLEMGLFSLGETMAMQLTQNDSDVIIYSFAGAIGFSTTMAEPSLTAIARKAKEISDGKVNDFVLRNDVFRTYVDSYIRGAKMVAVNEHSDGVVETVMELKLEPRFRACVSKVADDQVQDLCPIPMPRDNDSIGDVQSRGVDSLYYLD